MKKIVSLFILVLLLALPAQAADTPPAVPDAVNSTAPATGPVPPQPPTPPASPQSAASAPAPVQTSTDPGMFGKLSHFFSQPDNNASPAEQQPRGHGRGGRGGGEMILPPKMNVERKADTKNLEMAREVVKLLGPDTGDRRERGLRRPGMYVTSVVIPGIAQENPGKEDKIQKISSDVMAKIDQKHADDEQEDRAIAYAQTFTYTELAELKNFYGSSAGKKLVKFSGELEAAEMQLKQDSAINKAYEMRAAVITELKKEDMKIPKEIQP